jgi:nitrate reductase NapD
MSARDVARREFMFGKATQPQSAEAHVSSLVIHGRPEHLESIKAALLSWDRVEIPACDANGKMVVTLETQSEFEIVQRLNAIHSIPGVLSAALVFHHFEAEQVEASHGTLSP